MLILSLLILPVPSQAYGSLPSLVSPVVNIVSGSARLFPSMLNWLFSGHSERQPQTVASRTARVSSIRLTSEKLVAYLGESYDFAAIGWDASGKVAHGAKFTWESQNPERVSVDQTGRATFHQAGQTTLVCRAGTAAAEVSVLVRGTRRPLQTDAEWQADQQSFHTSQSGTIGIGNRFSTLLKNLSPTVAAQGTVGGDMPQSASLNFVGNPYNALLEPTRLGTVKPRTNFNIGFPVVSLGGRGLSANLALYYNSNVWGRAPARSTPSIRFRVGPRRAFRSASGASLGTTISMTRALIRTPTT